MALTYPQRPITLRADPYTIVIIPGIRGPTAYAAGGFNISVGQLSKVEHAMAHRGFASGAWSRSLGLGPVDYYVTSGSGNIITIQAFRTSGEEFAGSGLSHVPFNLIAYGH